MQAGAAEDEWVALLFETDPDVYCAGLDRHKQSGPAALSSDGTRPAMNAYDHAEQMSTRH